MKQSTCCGRLLAFAIASAGILSGQATAADEIKIAGTGAALGTMRQLGEAYSKRHPGAKIAVLPSLGSGGGLQALAKDAIDIAVTSRPMNEEFRKLGLVEREYGRTPFVFAVSTKSKVTAITLGQVADLYAGRTPSWPDGSQVRFVLRPIGDGESEQLRKMSPRMAEALTRAEKIPGTPFAVTDQESADSLERIPGSFGVITLAVIRSEHRSLRALELDGVAPTVENAASGRYPHYKQLSVVTRAEPSAATTRFLAFVRSPDGAAILVRNGHWLP
jgi:phosphate transport system substrate-binding protein